MEEFFEVAEEGAGRGGARFDIEGDAKEAKGVDEGRREEGLVESGGAGEIGEGEGVENRDDGAAGEGEAREPIFESERFLDGVEGRTATKKQEARGEKVEVGECREGDVDAGEPNRGVGAGDAGAEGEGGGGTETRGIEEGERGSGGAEIEENGSGGAGFGGAEEGARGGEGVGGDGKEGELEVSDDFLEGGDLESRSENGVKFEVEIGARETDGVVDAFAIDGEGEEAGANQGDFGEGILSLEGEVRGGTLASSGLDLGEDFFHFGLGKGGVWGGAAVVNGGGEHF